MPDYFERDKGLCKYLPAEGWTFIDVGANEGAWTLHFAGGYHTVHAFEPDPRSREILLSNLAAANVKNVQVHGYALADYQGDLTLRRFDSTQQTTPIFGTPATPAGHDDSGKYKFVDDVKIPCDTLDNFVASQGVFATPLSIKIDVEGGEFNVLHGAIHTINQYSPQLFVEIHSTELKNRIIPFLEGFGYAVTIVRHPNYKADSPYYDHHLWLHAYLNHRAKRVNKDR